MRPISYYYKMYIPVYLLGLSTQNVRDFNSIVLVYHSQKFSGCFSVTITLSHILNLLKQNMVTPFLPFPSLFYIGKKNYFVPFY